MSPDSQFLVDDGAYTFEWDVIADVARLTCHGRSDEIWRGSLLPLYWVASSGGSPRALKAAVPRGGCRLQPNGGMLELTIGDLATGRLRFSAGGRAFRIDAIELNWATPQAVPILGMYFGCDVLTATQRAAVPNLDLPFWPNWRSEGFAVASAKTNPMQSFFRSWDFGHANIPLGSFGPAMGTPYAAAFPRPVYAACAGGQHGWICMGSGAVPDAALTFQIRARSAALEWRYREDLWGAPTAMSRRWENPLWLTWADSAWTAYQQYFGLFNELPPKSATHQKSFWGTWGDFRRNEFEWRSSVDRARDQMEAALICIDDPWEARKGSCRPDPARLPTFAADIAYAHEKKIGVGIWMPTGWIESPEVEGLTFDDLLPSRDGVPVRSNWAIDPHEPSQAFFCLDPSTTGTRRFLRERTRRVIREYRPTLLKIDFGYGVPGPDACAPRDPHMRGERLAWTYAKLIADAAHELDTNITVLGYSIHPLWALAQDQVSLDDLGDAGAHEAAGHGQWSIWAALVASRGTALMGSSGYHWHADADVLMNSAVLGAPGANLPRLPPDGQPPPASLARRRGVFRWHRRTTRWEPLWLDSERGDLTAEPTVRNWGRLERVAEDDVVTALALREPTNAVLTAPELRGLRFTGRWILISQDNASIFDCTQLAAIPLEVGTIAIPRDASPSGVSVVFAERHEPHEDWHWHGGRLTITVNAQLAQRPFLGLVIHSRNAPP